MTNITTKNLNMTDTVKNYFENAVSKLVASAQNNEIIVLKGFPSNYILDLINNGRQFLDRAAIDSRGRVILEQENFMPLFAALAGMSNGPQFMTYESLLTLYSNLQDLSVTGKRFTILENNLMDAYANPTDTSIPDFDTAHFEGSNGNELFSNLYSNCSHENGREMVEYINIPDSLTNITVKPFVEPAQVPSILPSSPSGQGELPAISTDGLSIDTLLVELFYTGSLANTSYLVETGVSGNAKLGLLLALAQICGITVNLYEKPESVDMEVRQELTDTLKQVWGYSSFRDLQVYKNLIADRSIKNISQGEVIENVVRQAECALGKREGRMHNVLLTAPTGAGKSLLFQMAGIYLANKYNALTIVVSPLVALMEDQVEHLKAKYSGVAALNGNRTPQEKQDIIQGIQDGNINIVYIAPEMLLSYSLTTFTGKRDIGLLVVDEAHTVTTWGRDFRVDYWFLGPYLKSSMKAMEKQFPIFAVTATAVWDPSGRNDMVFETISSLNMAPCNKYIGVVRRNDIEFDIQNPNIAGDYHQERIDLTADFVRSTIEKGQKAIVYFPFKKDIDSFIDNAGLRDVEDRISRFHAGMPALERNMSIQDFKSGKSLVMLATKAFGMGIDVPDINTVYHHAPSGSLSDYIQEIGRAARKPGMTGTAKIDFSEKDLRFTKQLFGLSAIKPYQVQGVLRKLMSLYRIKGNKRNMIIAPDDFAHLFPDSDKDLDQKVKSTLLLISHDLLRSHNYNMLIVRPKNMFSKSYISLPQDMTDSFKLKYSQYIETDPLHPGIFLLDCEKLWNNAFSNKTFNDFKYRLGTGTLNSQLMPELNQVTILNKLTLMLNASVHKTALKLEEFFDLAERILDHMAQSHHRYALSEIRSTVLAHMDREEKEQFLETFRFLYCRGNNPYCKFYCQEAGNEQTHLQLNGNGYNSVRAQYLSLYGRRIQEEMTTMYAQPQDNIFELAQILDSLGLGTYERIGGEKPSIFVRINNPFYMNSLAKNPGYRNGMLESVYDKFECSKELFTHFFTHSMDNNTRWNFVEDYFLGTPIEKLLEYGL